MSKSVRPSMSSSATLSMSKFAMRFVMLPSHLMEALALALETLEVLDEVVALLVGEEALEPLMVMVLPLLLLADRSARMFPVSSATMFPANSADRSPDSSARMFLASSATRFPVSNARMFLDRNAAMSQDSSARMFPDRLPERSAPMFPGSSARMFPDRLP